MSLESITSTGKKEEPPFFLIHGLGGVGKSSLAASVPGAFFFDCEGSTSGMDVARCEPESFTALMSYLELFYKETHEYKAVIIDTLDWAEKLASSEVCKELGITSPNEASYGKAWALINGRMTRLLGGLVQLHSKGFTILVLAHSEIVPFKNPLGDDYDMLRIKCRDKTSELFRERPQLVGYMHRPILTTKDEKASGFQQKIKATIMRNSVLSCVPNAAYDAKNRFGITDDINIPVENGWAAVQAAIGK